MKRILVIGNFGYKTCIHNGQSIRTQTIYNSLKSYVTDYKIVYADVSHKGLSSLLEMMINLLLAQKIIMMPGINGLRKLIKILKATGRLRDTTFVAVGGWLGDYVEEHYDIKKELELLNAILVQTIALRNNLIEYGLTNSVVFPNYRNFSKDVYIERLKNEERKGFVFYSRVCREKGVDMAIRAFMGLKHDCYLDIYGPIQHDFEDEFEELLLLSDDINYKGVLSQDEVLCVLSMYSAMVFPTHYEGEGFPGVILESFLSGVPVIASDWKYNSEIVKDGYTGYIHENRSEEDLLQKMEMLLTSLDKGEDFKSKCLAEATKYSEEKVFPILLQQLKI